MQNRFSDIHLLERKNREVSATTDLIKTIDEFCRAGVNIFAITSIRLVRRKTEVVFKTKDR